MQLRSVARHLAIHGVDQETAERDGRGAAGRGGQRLSAPNVGLCARRELENAERLCDVVVGPGVEQIDLFVLRVPR